ncbi:Putative uncharacterized protein [Thermotoga neapolitana DSM 4359]|uniref:Uncharacterized protein n=1 Tax=Thermotoga neapolitana (strain ATCC 49049 / DSM 4359 / NBRC 107923 / NS-E) TaxID=309803 RepID=B9KC22_THENN|nr:Putative uncharacterized protein [Thermotoga neapolitana DSM 4359]
MFFQIVHDPVFFQDPKEKLWYRIEPVLLSCGEILQHSIFEIYLQFVSLVDLIDFLQLYDGKPHVDGVSVEDPRKGFCHDTGNSGDLYDACGVLSGRAKAEVLSCHYDVSLLNFLCKIFHRIFEDVLCKFFEVVSQVKVPSRCYVIGRYVVSELPYPSPYHALPSLR